MTNRFRQLPFRSPRGAIHWARAQVLGTEFGPAIAMLMGGTTAGQIIGVAAAPILTRLYSPADFGEFTLFLSILAVMASISTLSYVQAIPLPHSHADAANVLALCFAIILAMGAATAVVMIVSGGALLTFLGADAALPVAVLIVFGQMAVASVGTMKHWMVRTKQFSQIAFNSLVQAASLVGGQLLFGILGFGSVGLLAGQDIGATAGSSRLIRAAWREHEAAFRQVSWAGMRAAAKRYRRFAFLATPGTLLNTIGLWLPFLVVTAVFGTAIGGQFALAERLIMLPGSLVALAGRQVFTSQGAIVAREDRDAFAHLFLRSSRMLAATAIPVATAIAITAPFVFPLVFGPEWELAGYFVAAMCPWLVAYVVANPTGSVLEILERQDLHVIRETFRILLIGASTVIIIGAGLEPLAAVVVMSLSLTSMYIIYALISWRAIVVWRRQGTAISQTVDPYDDDNPLV